MWGGYHNNFWGFASGIDTIALTDSAFSLSSLSLNFNFFVIGEQFNGTNTSASGSSPYLVVDTTKPLCYNSKGTASPGYTVLAKNASGDAPAVTDISLL